MMFVSRNADHVIHAIDGGAWKALAGPRALLDDMMIVIARPPLAWAIRAGPRDSIDLRIGIRRLVSAADVEIKRESEAGDKSSVGLPY